MKSNTFARLKLDFGLRQLWPQWKNLFSGRDLKADTVAGLTVACVAIPLSLAIALASGVAPEIGLISAIVGGIVCALFGGTPLAVSGPAAAMAVLIVSTVQTHGFGGLLLIGLGCGLLQILSGFFSWGRFARLVPMPVVAGFTAGIGAVIFIGQMPRALGLPPPPQSETLHILTHLGDYLHATNLTSLSLSLATLAIIFGLPKLAPRIPATIIAVALVTVVAAFMKLETALIGAIPDSLPMPQLPALPTEGLGAIALATLTVFALASLETLLSSTAVDKLARSSRHDPNQELIGQGLGNVAASMFGGIPVTGVIARSALNVQSGGRTRRAGIIHAFALIIAVYFGSGLIAQIPLAALAGVLLAVSIKMMNWREFRDVLRVSKSEAGIYALTFATIVATDLLVGIQVGVIAAIVITAVRAAQTKVDIQTAEAGQVSRIQISGALSFLSSSSFESIREYIESLKHSGQNRIVIDMTDVTRLDATGTEELVGIVRDVASNGSMIVLQGTRPQCQSVLTKGDHEGVLKNRFATTESEVQTLLLGSTQQASERLLYGVRRFRREKDMRMGLLLKQLVNGQSPHTLFLTCSDSRINPNLLTSTDLGELFVVRNVGNAIPPYRESGISSEASAVEFAIKGLGIREIVICGHTGCGAMKAICYPTELYDTPSLRRYIASEAFQRLHVVDLTPDEASQANIIAQRSNLLTYPFVKELVDAGELKIHLWIYDLKRADIDAWNEATASFEPFHSLRSATTEQRVTVRKISEIVGNERASLH